MIQFKVKHAKDFFFDRKAVLAGVDRAARRVLSLFGVRVRQTARKLIKPPKKKDRNAYYAALHQARESGKPLTDGKFYSKPGQPPYSRTGLLRDFIFFLYNRSTQSVLIGPALFNGSDIPGLLEQGGTARRNGKRVRYQPRPYMGPALKKREPELTEMWRGAVKI